MSIHTLFTFSKYTIFIGILLTVTGCANTGIGIRGDTVDSSDDRIEPVNRVFFDLTETLDKYILKPVAEAYVEVSPSPLRTGITNFFENLTYLDVILNDWLQGKFEQGINDTLRFIFNSTLGIGGIFDVAGNDMRLEKHNEDFGQTLAVWGVGKGTYLYVPFQGPKTVRETADYIPSTLLNPLFYVSNAALFPFGALQIINKRANMLEATNIRDEAMIDPYIFTREAYLQRREYLIHDGNPPVDDYDDLFNEETESNKLIIK